MTIERLPLQLFGLRNIPAVPVQIEAMLDTLVRLGIRAEEVKLAVEGLTTEYTIGGTTATAYEFLYGQQSAHSRSLALDGLASLLKANPARVHAALFEELAKGTFKNLAQPEAIADPGALTSLSLDDPKQGSISWTTYADLYREFAPSIDHWASSLETTGAADAQFWSNIATYSLGYNLLILQKAAPSDLDRIKGQFPGVGALESLVAAGTLYFIDLTLFSTLKPQTVDGFTRFTPNTFTLLQQDPQTKDLTPIAIRVAGYGGGNAQVYVPSSPAWLYALQAAKTSVTVYGIWIGHVYHYHIVTAALQMTMYNILPPSHPIYALIAPQAKYLIPFDDVLLLLWKQISPPTSVSTAWQFLELTNQFATNRSYFDDDPIPTLEKNGIREEDFTSDPGQPWDKFLIVRQNLTIWNATQDYVRVFVDTTYPDDASVASDKKLQAWIAASSNPRQGNVRGLPAVKDREALQRVLTSLLYRITAHGAARLLSSTHPVLAFVSNFPPCLQNADIPSPGTALTPQQLLAYLPKTGTIGSMMTFYFTFCFSAPYEPFVPLYGVESNPFFPNGPSDPRNRALAQYRTAVQDFIAQYSQQSPPKLVQTYQWPLNIET